MKSYNIAVVPGDGTGPEVIREGIKVLDALSVRFGFSVRYHQYDFGGDRYVKTGEILSDKEIDAITEWAWTL